MDTIKIITRAKAILLTPKTEWPTIAAETDSVARLYTGYILVMAAVPAIVRLLSSTLLGVSVPFMGTYRIPIVWGLTSAILTYVLALIGVYIVALIVDALAPTFNGEKNHVQALKTVAYAYTASWVASIIGIIPGLMLLAALVGVGYGIYLLRLGLPVTMKCPDDKAVGYTAATIVVAIVIAIVLNVAVGAILRTQPYYVPGAGGFHDPLKQ
jgi:Yip1 domain